MDTTPDLGDVREWDDLIILVGGLLQQLNAVKLKLECDRGRPESLGPTGSQSPDDLPKNFNNEDTQLEIIFGSLDTVIEKTSKLRASYRSSRETTCIMASEEWETTRSTRERSSAEEALNLTESIQAIPTPVTAGKYASPPTISQQPTPPISMDPHDEPSEPCGNSSSTLVSLRSCATRLQTCPPRAKQRSETIGIGNEAQTGAVVPRTPLPSTRCIQSSPGGAAGSKRQLPSSRLSETSKKIKGLGIVPIAKTEVPSEVGKLMVKLMNYDKLCRFPPCSAIDPPGPKMLLRVAAVQGGPAIRQFCSLVFSRRSLDTESGLLHGKDTGIERALRLSKSLATLTGRSNYNSFILRLVQYHIAQTVDNNKLGRIRADPAQLKETMDKFGWSQAERPRFFYHLKQGRLWRSICGRFVGLLSLIPLRAEEPYCLSANDYLSLKSNEMERFTRLTETPFVERICHACSIFQDMVMGNRCDGDFRWEKEHPELRSWSSAIDEDNLLSLLQPFPGCEENIYEPSLHPGWPKPAGWLADWSWPGHPLAVPPADRQCDLCTDTRCACIRERLQAKSLRIKLYARQGLGLQATEAQEGNVSYRKGDVIGQLCGELVPAGTYPTNSSFVIEMARPDISEETAVCQIYMGNVGNNFRLLNHSCRASARVRALRVSGHWVSAIEASRSIRHGEQITVNFGKRFLRNQGLRCECDACGSV
ncbi:Putative SET domain-containing protein [Colletotrichum destructivum]|uniref:SET domain-containing protein n=1 Tax=Colletotrichum destructivum TaxID=34406 RepID=A0AAX4IXS9_9PEZI|nr:Putative SET domain-containing protein [Colletotrichum destructivum]